MNQIYLTLLTILLLLKYETRSICVKHQLLKTKQNKYLWTLNPGLLCTVPSLTKDCAVQTCHLTWSLSSFPKHLIKSDYLSLGEMTNPSSPNKRYLMPLLDKHRHLTFDSLFYLRIKKRRFFSPGVFLLPFLWGSNPTEALCAILSKASIPKC